MNHLHSQFATNNRIKTIKFLPQTTEKKVVYDTKNVRTRETLVIKLLLLEKNGKIALVRTNTLQNGNIYFVFSHRVRNISNINVFCTRFRSINQNGRHKTTQQEYNISH